jgi:YcaO-like protein with predicted kinase domain
MTSGYKEYRYGTERAVDPARTYERIAPMMRPIGVTRVANVTGLDVVGIPVFLACRPNSRALAVSQGKGCTDMAARVSAMMESLELYHAERVHSPLRFASYDELRSRADCVWTDRLQLVEGSSYSDFNPLLWIEARRIGRAGPVWIPFELVHTNMTLPVPAVNAFLRTSNGLASGNTDIEAIAHGLWEVVERDCTALWDLRPREERAASKLDPDSVDDPACRSLLQAFAQAEVEVAVWDITNDLAVPAFAAMIRDARPNPFHRMVLAGGFGAHANRAVALSRALTEAAQSRVTAISGARDDVTRRVYEETAAYAHAPLSDAYFADAGTRRFHDAPHFAGDGLEDDVAQTLERLAARGVEDVLVADLTREEFGIPVFKVVVPALERARLPGYLPGPRARAVRA